MSPVNVESLGQSDAECHNCRCYSSCAPRCCTCDTGHSEDNDVDMSGEQTHRVNEIAQQELGKSKCCVIL